MQNKFSIYFYDCASHKIYNLTNICYVILWLNILCILVGNTGYLQKLATIIDKLVETT